MMVTRSERALTDFALIDFEKGQTRSDIIKRLTNVFNKNTEAEIITAVNMAERIWRKRHGN